MKKYINFSFSLKHYFIGFCFCLSLPFIDFVKFIDNVTDIQNVKAKVIDYKEEVVRGKGGLKTIYYPIVEVNFKNNHYKFVEYSSYNDFEDYLTLLVTNNNNGLIFKSLSFHSIFFGRIYYFILIFITFLFFLPTFILTKEFKNFKLDTFFPSDYILYTQIFQMPLKYKIGAIMIILIGVYTIYTYYLLGYLILILGFIILCLTHVTQVDFTNWEVYDGIGLLGYPLGKPENIEEINDLKIEKIDELYLLIVRLNHSNHVIFNTISLFDVQNKYKEVKTQIEEYL